MQPAAIREALAKLDLAGPEADAALAEARSRIAIAAVADRHQQLGMALVRLNDLYRRSLAIQDCKTALAAQRELNRLLRLDAQAHDGPLQKELDAARAHLEPLRLATDAASLPELCRLAVARILTLSYGRSPQPPPL